jgi:hypothetical protein
MLLYSYIMPWDDSGKHNKACLSKFQTVEAKLVIVDNETSIERETWRAINWLFVWFEILTAVSRKMADFRVRTSSIIIALKMEAARTSETSVSLHQPAQSCINL